MTGVDGIEAAAGHAAAVAGSDGAAVPGHPHKHPALHPPADARAGRPAPQRGQRAGDIVEIGGWAEGDGGEVAGLLDEVVGLLQAAGHGSAATAAREELVKAASSGDRLSAAHALSRLKVLTPGGARVTLLVARIEQVLRGTGMI